MNKSFIIAAIAGVVSVAAIFNSVSSNADGVMYKSPYCGCCTGYSEKANKHGIKLKTINVEDMFSIKEKYGITDNLSSCHTILIEGYIVEGHVPVIAINKLLSERPDIKGITLPGMPIGTAGMPGPQDEDWNILALHKDGHTSNFMTIKR